MNTESTLSQLIRELQNLKQTKQILCKKVSKSLAPQGTLMLFAGKKAKKCKAFGLLLTLSDSTKKKNRRVPLCGRRKALASRWHIMINTYKSIFLTVIIMFELYASSFSLMPAKAKM